MKKIIFGILLISSAWLFADGPNLKTGQTKCYNGSTEIACPAEGEAYHGQDGNYLLGTARSYTRDPAKGIVTDNVTGLQWQDNAHPVLKQWVTTTNYGAGRYNDTSGDTATTYCSALPLDVGGWWRSWRLPTKRELTALGDKGRFDPAIYVDGTDGGTNNGFVYTSSNEYWSATTYVPFTGYAWVMDFNGTGESVDIFIKTSTCSVRCVRSRQWL